MQRNWIKFYLIKEYGEFMKCTFTSEVNPCNCRRVILLDSNGNSLPNERFEIVEYDCKSIMIKIKDDVEFSDDELKILYNSLIERIDDGGTPTLMGRYLGLYEKLGKLIGRKHDK